MTRLDHAWHDAWPYCGIVADYSHGSHMAQLYAKEDWSKPVLIGLSKMGGKCWTETEDG
jgi:hypothetical protein